MEAKAHTCTQTDGIWIRSNAVGLVERLGNSLSVIPQQSAVYHKLQVSVFEACRSLGSVCEHRKLEISVLDISAGGNREIISPDRLGDGYVPGGAIIQLFLS